MRLFLAGAITLLVLPYAWGRTLVVGAIQGQPEWPYLGLTVIGVLAVIALSYRLAIVFSRRWVHGVVSLAIAGPWLIIMGGLVAAHIETDISKPLFLGLFLLATLWVPWAGWMFYRPMTPWLRWGVLVGLVGGVVANRLLLRMELNGDADVYAAWRAPKRSLAARTFRGAVDLDHPTAEDFPQFLGPERTAVLPNAHLDPDWVRNPPREMWRHDVGEGWGGFAVVGGFAITQEQRGPQECVVCYRVADGSEAWVHADAVRFDSSLGGPGPRATPTIA